MTMTKTICLACCKPPYAHKSRRLAQLASFSITTPGPSTSRRQILPRRDRLRRQSPLPSFSIQTFDIHHVAFYATAGRIPYPIYPFRRNSAYPLISFDSAIHVQRQERHRAKLVHLQKLVEHQHWTRRTLSSRDKSILRLPDPLSTLVLAIAAFVHPRTNKRLRLSHQT